MAPMTSHTSKTIDPKRRPPLASFPLIVTSGQRPGGWVLACLLDGSSYPYRAVQTGHVARKSYGSPDAVIRLLSALNEVPSARAANGACLDATPRAPSQC